MRDKVESIRVTSLEGEVAILTCANSQYRQRLAEKQSRIDRAVEYCNHIPDSCSNPIVKILTEGDK
jgi:acyl-CoA hydrolase